MLCTIQYSTEEARICNKGLLHLELNDLSTFFAMKVNGFIEPWLCCVSSPPPLLWAKGGNVHEKYVLMIHTKELHVMVFVTSE